MQKSNISTYRAQRVDAKMTSFFWLCLLSKYSSLECQKWLILCNFGWIQKKTDPTWIRYLNTAGRSYLAFLQDTMDYGFLPYH